MRPRLLIALAVSLVGLLLLQGSRINSAPPPPPVRITNIEPSGVFDEQEAEMRRINLSIGQPLTWSNQDSRVYHKDVRVEAKLGKGWVNLETPFLGYCLAPAKADVCRVRLKYTGARVVTGRWAWLAERLPGAVRYRLPRTFWRWAGFVQYGPRPDWHDLTVELPLDSSAAPPGRTAQE